jgi:phosphoglycolate phosphatase-like HAD superfamily hydrolase
MTWIMPNRYRLTKKPKDFCNPLKYETIVVGDTPWDIEAANKAGLRTIGVLCGGFSREDLRGAVSIFLDPADLLARYHDSPLSCTTD